MNTDSEVKSTFLRSCREAGVEVGVGEQLTHILVLGVLFQLQYHLTVFSTYSAVLQTKRRVLAISFQLVISLSSGWQPMASGLDGACKKVQPGL